MILGVAWPGGRPLPEGFHSRTDFETRLFAYDLGSDEFSLLADGGSHFSWPRFTPDGARAVWFQRDLHSTSEPKVSA